MLKNSNHYKLRKLTVGLVSVCAGVLFMTQSKVSLVKADITNQNNNKVIEQTKTNKQEDLNQNTNQENNKVQSDLKQQNNVQAKPAVNSVSVSQNSVIKQTKAALINAEQEQNNNLNKQKVNSKDNQKTTSTVNVNYAKQNLSNQRQIQRNINEQKAVQKHMETSVKNNNLQSVSNYSNGSTQIKVSTIPVIKQNSLLDNKSVSDVSTNVNDAYALNAKNDMHEHSDVNVNGGYDQDYWGKLDATKWTGTLDNYYGLLTLTGYTGDKAHVIIPNAADFQNAGRYSGVTVVAVNQDEMKSLAQNATTLAISKTKNEVIGGGGTEWSQTFANDKNLVKMDLHNLHTTIIQDMQFMFSGDINLTNTGDLGSWDLYNVWATNCMFMNDSKLTGVGDLSNWNTGNDNYMEFMFNGCSNISDLGNLDNWNTANVTNMNSMFSGMHALTNIGKLDNWNLSNVTDTYGMFLEDLNLPTIGDLSKWQTGKVTNMANMFGGCNKIINLGNLDNWDTSNVTDMSGMFSAYWYTHRNALTNIGDLSKWNTSKVTDMEFMFYNCDKLKSIGKLNNWQTGKVTNMCSIFCGANAIVDLGNLDNWNVSKVTNMDSMFAAKNGLDTVHTDKAEYYEKALSNIGDLSKWNVANVTNMNSMFNDCTNLSAMGDLSNWQIGKVTDMSAMFQNCYKIKDLGNLGKWNVGNVTDTEAMFNMASSHVSGTSSLSNIGDLSNWDTGKITNMSYMFANDSALSNIGNLSKWNTSSVTDMGSMFQQTGLTNIGNLNNWETGKVTDMSYMFAFAHKLSNVGDLSKWNISNVKSTYSMFEATSLQNIGDLSNWQTSNDTDMSYMFSMDYKLKQLNISNWNFKGLSDGSKLEYAFYLPNTVVIANNLQNLPQGIGDDSGTKPVVFTDHMVVITNNKELTSIPLDGSLDGHYSDKENAYLSEAKITEPHHRSIFYDDSANTSVDPAKLVLDDNIAWMKSQVKAPGYGYVDVNPSVDITDPISIANGLYEFALQNYNIKIEFKDTDPNATQDPSYISQILNNRYGSVRGKYGKLFTASDLTQITFPFHFVLDTNKTLPSGKYGINNVLIIDVKHATTTISYTNPSAFYTGTGQSDLNGIGTRAITINFPANYDGMIDFANNINEDVKNRLYHQNQASVSGHTVTIVQHVDFVRNATVDLVTGTVITYSQPSDTVNKDTNAAWWVKAGESPNYSSITLPKISGYTPEITPKVDPLTGAKYLALLFVANTGKAADTIKRTKPAKPNKPVRPTSNASSVNVTNGAISEASITPDKLMFNELHLINEDNLEKIISKRMRHLAFSSKNFSIAYHRSKVDIKHIK